MDKEDNLLLEEYSYIRTKQKTKAPDVKKAWQQFENEHILKRKLQKPTRRITLYRYAAAIAALLILTMGGIGIWWNSGGEQIVENNMTRKYIQQVEQQGDGLLVAFESNHAPQQIMLGCDDNTPKPIQKSVACKSIKADTTKAIVTAEAKRILDIATKTIITPRGKTYTILLSDGTEVVLNADSKLVFPTNFIGKKERKVKLLGEAFFKVAKDAKHPFIVETASIRTTVLGTEFNVKAYPEGSPKVTLLSGSIKVTKTNPTKEKEESVILIPNQEMTLSDNDILKVSSLGDNATQCVKWKEGLFAFHATPLFDAIQDIGRWYNVDVEVTDDSLKKETITLTMPRNISLEDFVNSINVTKNLSAILDDGKIVICPKDARLSVKFFSLCEAQRIDTEQGN
nr:FecR family protein [uncultured Prevotella sp.]